MFYFARYRRYMVGSFQKKPVADPCGSEQVQDSEKIGKEMLPGKNIGSCNLHRLFRFENFKKLVKLGSENDFGTTVFLPGLFGFGRIDGHKFSSAAGSEATGINFCTIQ